jgi:alkanesulfonate monooxygenase SsuD/methylene tetrahydromethanopterin reductase-like flavin-dependent oxidoreductase (luciferase family)
MMDAIGVYRSAFRPSAQLERPYVMLGFNVFAADTEEEARTLVSSAQQGFLNLRRGQPRQVQPPIRNFEEQLSGAERALLNEVLACSAIGTRDIVRQKFLDFVELTGADELMIASMIYDHGARVRSYEIAASALDV